MRNMKYLFQLGFDYSVDPEYFSFVISRTRIIIIQITLIVLFIRLSHVAVDKKPSFFFFFYMSA
jgi:hypothetical protein